MAEAPNPKLGRLHAAPAALSCSQMHRHMPTRLQGIGFESPEATCGKTVAVSSLQWP